MLAISLASPCASRPLTTKADALSTNQRQENAKAVEAHFTKVLNSEHPTHANAAETVQQQETKEELGETPTWEELKRAAVKLKMIRNQA
jgi:hypothetical protein